MNSKDEWAGHTKRFMKAELKCRDVTYKELARRLPGMGVDESEGSVAMKINRGAFPTWFLLASMKAIGCPAVRVEDI